MRGEKGLRRGTRHPWGRSGLEAAEQAHLQVTGKPSERVLCPDLSLPQRPGPLSGELLLTQAPRGGLRWGIAPSPVPVGRGSVPAGLAGRAPVASHGVRPGAGQRWALGSSEPGGPFQAGQPWAGSALL